jgi:hypothetical protein
MKAFKARRTFSGKRAGAGFKRSAAKWLSILVLTAGLMLLTPKKASAQKQQENAVADSIMRVYPEMLKKRGINTIPELTWVSSLPMPDDISKGLQVEDFNGNLVLILGSDELERLSSRKENDMSPLGSKKLVYLKDGTIYVFDKKY